VDQRLGRDVGPFFCVNAIDRGLDMNDSDLPSLLPTQRGFYRHYKGGLYEVIDTARHSETLEPMTVYRALYGEHGLWVRPAAMFAETVEVDGVTRLRFEKISDV
jgi:hypothetical protein